MFFFILRIILSIFIVTLEITLIIWILVYWVIFTIPDGMTAFPGILHAPSIASAPHKGLGIYAPGYIPRYLTAGDLSDAITKKIRRENLPSCVIRPIFS
jgi:hypothetical protein